MPSGWAEAGPSAASDPLRGASLNPKHARLNAEEDASDLENPVMGAR